MHKDNNIKFMEATLEEARKSGDDVPIGAVLVYNGKIIAKAHNRKELENDATSHAEILVIKEASKILKSWRLENTILYVTLEPCPMCAAAILYSRIPEIVFGAYDPLYGALVSALNMSDFIQFTPKITGGILEQECSKLIKDFFKKQRIS